MTMPFKDDAELTAALLELRPAPGPAFAAELDERAAAGFPRRAGERLSLPAKLAARLRGTPPRRLLLPAGAAALTAVAIATVVIAAGSDRKMTSLSSTTTYSGTQRSFGGTPPNRLESEIKTYPGFAAGAGNAGGGTAQKQHNAAAGTSAGAAGESSTSEFSRPIPSTLESAAAGLGRNGGAVGGARHRDVERAAQMVLGADPDEVDDAAAKVFDAVHAANGIVLRSSVSGGEGAGARFDLLIPRAGLRDALAAFSGIAEVRSRHESTADITAPTVAVSERLADSRARIDSLLAQLAGAGSESEREAVEAELRAERRRAARLGSRVERLHRRADLSRVLLRIESADGSARAPGGGWDLGDALHDAGRILAVAAGVVLVALAVITPLALIALLAWLGRRAWVRESRRRALG